MTRAPESGGSRTAASSRIRDITNPSPRRLFSLPAALGGFSTPYDTDPNGDGFVMSLMREDAAVRHLNVILNFDEELKQRVPVE